MGVSTTPTPKYPFSPKARVGYGLWFTHRIISANQSLQKNVYFYYTHGKEKHKFRAFATIKVMRTNTLLTILVIVAGLAGLILLNSHEAFQPSPAATQPTSTLPQATTSDQKAADSPILTVGTTTLNLEVVSTYQARQRGLSGRSSLSENSGMLFIFPEPDRHGIWMKEMQFAIDIIWLDKNFRVVNVKKNARPESYPKVFKPREPARYVLEVNASFTKTNDISRGDKLHISGINGS